MQQFQSARTQRRSQSRVRDSGLFQAAEPRFEGQSAPAAAWSMNSATFPSRSTCTTPAAPESPMPMRQSRPAYAYLTEPSAGSAGAPLPRERPETSCSRILPILASAADCQPESTPCDSFRCAKSWKGNSRTNPCTARWRRPGRHPKSTGGPGRRDGCRQAMSGFRAASTNRLVYSVSGFWRTLPVGPCSTTFPCCMTMMLWHSAFTTFRSWLMKR